MKGKYQVGWGLSIIRKYTFLGLKTLCEAWDGISAHLWRVTMDGLTYAVNMRLMRVVLFLTPTLS